MRSRGRRHEIGLRAGVLTIDSIMWAVVRSGLLGFILSAGWFKESYGFEAVDEERQTW